MTTNAGRLEVITGCMFSGKSEELIRRLRRAEIAKLSTLSFKPAMDDRYDALSIASHSSHTIKTTPVESVEEIRGVFTFQAGVDVVGIDEAQFFDDELIDVINHMVKKGVRVIVAGLDTDWRGQPFGIMPHLMAVSDKVLKLSAVCTLCGAAAIHTNRLTHSTELVQVGATGMYDARCRNCFDPRGAL